MTTQKKTAGGEPAAGFDISGGGGCLSTANYSTLAQHYQALLDQADRLMSRDIERYPIHWQVWTSIHAAKLTKHEASALIESLRREAGL